MLVGSASIRLHDLPQRFGMFLSTLVYVTFSCSIRAGKVEAYAMFGTITRLHTVHFMMTYALVWTLIQMTKVQRCPIAVRTNYHTVTCVSTLGDAR